MNATIVCKPKDFGVITLEEFMANDYESYEFVEGELRPMSTPTMEHGQIGVNIIILLHSYVKANKLGRVYSIETTFQVGNSGRKPDVAFLFKEHIPANVRQASSVPPDLAVEIVSPSDTLYDVQEKVFEYLDAGTQLVWVIEPVGQTVTVYRSRTDIKVLTVKDTLTGEDVIKGFHCSVAEIFE
ncbi:Uma2 family endonuclease [Candidatus Poribacteria bacterium]|nr:Uma2 family endonuclease [Candidatus Poribacteria bacterium]